MAPIRPSSQSSQKNLLIFSYLDSCNFLLWLILVSPTAFCCQNPSPHPLLWPHQSSSNPFTDVLIVSTASTISLSLHLWPYISSAVFLVTLLILLHSQYTPNEENCRFFILLALPPSSVSCSLKSLYHFPLSTTCVWNFLLKHLMDISLITAIKSLLKTHLSMKPLTPVLLHL